MKKQFFTLILSAAIFTTNPLFAMDGEKEPFKFSGQKPKTYAQAERKRREAFGNTSEGLKKYYDALTVAWVLYPDSVRKQNEEMNKVHTHLLAHADTVFPKLDLCISNDPQTSFTALLNLDALETLCLKQVVFTPHTFVVLDKPLPPHHMEQFNILLERIYAQLNYMKKYPTASVEDMVRVFESTRFEEKNIMHTWKRY